MLTSKVEKAEMEAVFHSPVFTRSDLSSPPPPLSSTFISCLELMRLISSEDADRCDSGGGERESSLFGECCQEELPSNLDKKDAQSSHWTEESALGSSAEASPPLHGRAGH